MCNGGLDLQPRVMTCGYTGLLFGIASWKNVILLLVVAAILYYGWPLVEAIIVKLPIPDPKDMKEKFSGVIQSIKNRGKGSNDAPNTKNYS